MPAPWLADRLAGELTDLRASPLIRWLRGSMGINLFIYLFFYRWANVAAVEENIGTGYVGFHLNDPCWQPQAVSLLTESCFFWTGCGRIGLKPSRPAPTGWKLTEITVGSFTLSPFKFSSCLFFFFFFFQAPHHHHPRPKSSLFVFVCFFSLFF